MLKRIDFFSKTRATYSGVLSDKVLEVFVFTENGFADNVLEINGVAWQQSRSCLVAFVSSQPSEFDSVFVIFVVEIQLCHDTGDDTLLFLNFDDKEIAPVYESGVLSLDESLGVTLLDQ